MNDVIIKRRTFPNNINLADSIHPLLRRIYLARGITSDDQLNHSTQGLINCNQLNNIDSAVTLLYEVANRDQKILVVGDFDTDGATSTALTMRALKQLGVKNVSYIIPDRFQDGYGLSVSVVKKALQKQVKLIITVDNGVSANEAVAFAKQHNVQVIITDHHLAPDELPIADAIINPNQSCCSFPSKNLAGVGVAFYFMLAFRTFLREKNWFKLRNIPEYNLANLLDLVALGTVADVVTLDHNNRILVQQGIARIRAGHSCCGIDALIKLTKRNRSKLTAQDLSYYLSPRINAAGRMENMALGVELLLADSEVVANEAAQILEDLNQQRKSVETNMHQDALAFIEHLDSKTKVVPNSFVIFHPDFHQGVIGILSSRIKEKFYRPVISFAVADDGYLKGSGRSVNGVHLRDILEKIHQKHPSLIVCFGGHAMAAGLTMKQSDLETFTQCFEKTVAKQLADKPLENIIYTDGLIDNQFFNVDTAIRLKDGGPWGEGFPEPLFDGQFKIHQQKLVGEKHLKFTLEPSDGGPIVEGIIFNIDRTIWPSPDIKKIEIVYNLEMDEFRGVQRINLLIRHIQIID